MLDTARTILGLSPLRDAEPILRQSPPRYGFDPRVARFRDLDTGRFVARETVIDFSFEMSTTSQLAADELAMMVTMDGGISATVWQQFMKQEIKEEYIRQYMLGIGGRAQMTAADWGSVGGMISDQYRYLDNFTAEIAAGNLTEGQIAVRAKMYINSAREAFERAQAKVMKLAGYDEVLWVVDPSKESCDDCLAFAAMDWQKVEDDPYGGCIPGRGCTKCLTNCGCHLQYRRSKK